MVGGGGGWLKVILVLSLSLKLNNKAQLRPAGAGALPELGKNACGKCTT